MEVLAAAAKLETGQRKTHAPHGSMREESPAAGVSSHGDSLPRSHAAPPPTAAAAAAAAAATAARAPSPASGAAPAAAPGVAAARQAAAGTEQKQQGAKRKRGAPPESCPFCGHLYTVRDGLSSHHDAAGNRLHLRRCQCRKKTPPCKNCPQCKQLPDVMQLCGGGTAADVAAAYELCQSRHACAICACRCPGAGKWVEGVEESRRAFRERTQRRQDELVSLGWQGQEASAAPASTAGDAGTASAGTATAAPSHSSDDGGPEAAARKRRGRRHHSQPARSGLSTRRLPADIRQQLEAVQQQRGPVRGGSPSSGLARPTLPLPPQRQAAGSAPAAVATTAAHTEMQPEASHLQPGHTGQSRRAGGKHQHERSHRHCGDSHAHHHTCSHPHEDCTSDCCSAPTGAVPVPGAAAAPAALPPGVAAVVAGAPVSGPLLMAQQPNLAALVGALDAAQQQQQQQEQQQQQGAAGPALAAPGVVRLWDQLAAAGVLPPAAALPLLQHTAPQPAGLPQASVPHEPPELPSEVTALVAEVFLHAAGEAAAAAVAAFLRRQRLTSLGDFEFLELEWLQQELGQGPQALPPLLLNKFVRLGRRRAAATGAGEGASP